MKLEKQREKYVSTKMELTVINLGVKAADVICGKVLK